MKDHPEVVKAPDDNRLPQHEFASLLALAVMVFEHERDPATMIDWSLLSAGAVRGNLLRLDLGKDERGDFAECTWAWPSRGRNKPPGGSGIKLDLRYALATRLVMATGAAIILNNSGKTETPTAERRFHPRFSHDGLNKYLLRRFICDAQANQEIKECASSWKDSRRGALQPARSKDLLMTREDFFDRLVLWSKNRPKSRPYHLPISPENLVSVIRAVLRAADAIESTADAYRDRYGTE